MAKRPSRELHDAFENDVDLDLGAVESRPGAGEAPIAEARRQLIEQLAPSRMLPDRFQPRPILPLALHQRFFAGQADAYATARSWLELAESDAGQRGRVDELMRMAESVDDHGQIKPITGAWDQAEDGGYLFVIETGERRFWGAVLRHVDQDRDGEPELRVEAVEAPSVERQIIENRHAQPPTAVAQAREIAALLLRRMDIRPDPGQDDPYDFFRQALDPPGRERLPRGIWGALEPVMQLTPRRMRQVLSVLALPTPLLERADVYGLSDRVLQAVLQAPEEARRDLLQSAIDSELSGDQIAEVAGELRGAPPRPRTSRRADHARSALRGLRGFSGALGRAGGPKRDLVLDQVADEIMIQEDARAVLGVLEALIGRLRARLEGMEE
jgi:hypothetical protein